MKKINSYWQTRLILVGITTVALCATISLASTQGGWERGDEWRAGYKAGDQVQFSISGNEAGLSNLYSQLERPWGCDARHLQGFQAMGRRLLHRLRQKLHPPLKDSEPKKEPGQNASGKMPGGQTPTQKKWGYGDEWRSEFAIGDKIQFSISGKAD
jgi:hypothetical protein